MSGMQGRIQNLEKFQTQEVVSIRRVSESSVRQSLRHVSDYIGELVAAYGNTTNPTLIVSMTDVRISVDTLQADPRVNVTDLLP